MIRLRKKSHGSMFKRFFTFMTITIITCILVASFSLMFFLVDFWKNDKLTRLSGDAQSLSRSVLTVYEGYYNRDIFAEHDELLNAAFRAVSDQANGEMLIASEDGRIVYCSERAGGSSVCPVHDNIVIDPEILESTFVAYPQDYSDQIDVRFQEEDVFLSAVAVATSDNRLFYVIAMQNASDAYLPYTTAFIKMFIRAGLLGVFVAFIGSLLTSLRMVRPLKKMTSLTKHYAEGDFSERINAGDNYSELAEFAESFNSMANSLERIDESRSAFVANTSHELKTPITIISGFIDGILDGTIPPEDTEKYLHIVSDETKRLSDLVVAMLNISKIEAGKLELSCTSVNLSHLICTVMLGFEQSVSKKKISVEGLDKLSPVSVWADETLLSQIVFNLVDNAVKFTPEEGRITVTLSQVENNAVFTIENTGRGIPKEDLDLIFERFYKVDRSRGLDSESFGIGLYIVKRIMELHHGTITVSSEENNYTRFVITLPMGTPKNDMTA